MNHPRPHTRARALPFSLTFALALALATACGDDAPGDDDDDTTIDAPAAADASPDAAPMCPRDPAPADRTRYVVVALPFEGDGTDYEVLALDSEGALTRSDTTFTMRRAFAGEIAFTADGAIGAAVQDDGTVGIFSLDESGNPTVLDAGFDGGGAFYAGSVLAAGDGSGRIYLLDSQTRENGGAIHAIDIDCDGTPFHGGVIAAAELPYALAFPSATRAAVAARDILDEPAAGDDVHLLDWSTDPPTYLDGADAFGDDEAIVSAAAVTTDGDHILVADNSAFSGIPNRVAVVAIDGDTLTPTTVLTPIEDPYDIEVSPFGGVAMVVSGFGDAVFLVDTDPFEVFGEPTYVGASPQLPGNAVTLTRGALVGHVLLAENQGVRQMSFGTDGGFVDIGLYDLGVITGAIGVQP